MSSWPAGTGSGRGRAVRRWRQPRGGNLATSGALGGGVAPAQATHTMNVSTRLTSFISAATPATSTEETAPAAPKPPPAVKAADTFEANAPRPSPLVIGGSKSLARATQLEDTNSVVPLTQREFDAAKSPGVRAAAADARIDGAVETASKALAGLMVSDDDGAKALAALAVLRPEEQGRALAQLDDAGKLDRLVSHLEPEKMLDLTRMLTASGIFPWKPANDAAGQPVEGAPRLIEMHALMPMPLQALAHDINLAIARQSPGKKLFEPGAQGGELDAKQHLQMAWRDGLFSGATRKAEAFVHKYLAVTDVDASVHQLRPGDSYRLTSDASVKVGLGAKGAEVSVGPALSAGIEVARSDDGKSYTVSGDSSLLARLSASAGLSAISKVKGELAAGGGGKVEFSFATADQASKAAQLLLEASGSPVKFAAHALAKPGDMAALAKGLSAVELGPQAAAKLGIDVEAGHNILGAEKAKAADLSGSAATTYRLEFKDGKPSAVSAKTSLQFESSVSQSQTFKAGDFSLDAGKAMSASVRADIERRVELKPGGQVSDAARSLLTGPATMTVALEAKKGGSFGESGAELEFKVEGETGALLGAAWALQHGDVASAAAAIEKAEVTSKRTATSGLSLSLGVEAAGDGGSVGMKAMRKRQLSKATVEGTGREMALGLLKSLGGEQGPAAPTAVTVRTVRPG